MFTTIKKRGEDGNQYVFKNDVLIAIHGEFCYGCEAKSGTCGDLTKAAVGYRKFDPNKCSGCGHEDVLSHLNGIFEWITDVLEDGEKICQECAFGLMHEAEVEDAIYRADRGIWED